MITIEKLEKFIQAHKKKNGYAPLIAQIAKHFNVTRAAIGYHFRQNETCLKKYDEYKRYYKKG